MSTSSTAPARLGAAVGRLLEPGATAYVYDWVGRTAEALDDPERGEPAFQFLLPRIKHWFDDNVPPSAMATAEQMEKCEEALQSATWLCQD